MHIINSFIFNFQCLQSVANLLETDKKHTFTFILLCKVIILCKYLHQNVIIKRKLDKKTLT